MIKVLHCYKTYYPDTFGGIEQVIYQLAEGGVKEGIQSTVFTHSPNFDHKITKHASHSIYRVKALCELASTPFSFSAIKEFKELAKQADIIHYHFPYPYMDFMHFAAGIRKPSVVSYHSDIVKQKALLKLYTPLMNRFLKSVDRIIAASPNYVESSPILQQFKSKVEVIPYGLEKNFYHNNEPAIVAKWLARFPDGFFLFIGTFRYYKGLHILIEAAQNSRYPIVIVGAGPIEAELKAQAQHLKVDNIYFLGALEDSDKSALLQLCTCLVFPSHLRSEAFGISLLEGALYSKPLISSEIGTGTTYINIDRVTGLVVPPSNPKALREAMDRIWNHPEQAKTYGEAAHERFESLFTADRMIESYTNLYKSLLNI
ncbi:glycosyltransferase family 4 protein [Candidatus Pantoea floridensis]|uniref:Rhamnosyl/mannosyltransferase n=1 Tax=Candidatus Pantoea floridensis TaxID=1938870 RepID=A0A286BXH6_9GAMM|nr:glycosyltransferase family 4 protein [Pantoea floridensis]PIF21353.1 rhamnosyl/mannosyltransferase [Enterobacteriaceae bacterium JKS000233]SOD38865.1 rhamnosyl/mannosyltransferase [Pantoea floridensis]